MVNVRAALKILDEQNLKLNCIDIGSAGGFHPLMKEISTFANLYGFDADPEEAKRLNSKLDKNQTILNSAVGSKNETRDFYLMKKRQSSSFYKYNQFRMSFFDNVEFSKERSEIEKIIQIKTNNLDQICKDQKISAIDFLKIDAEGFEVEILEGCSSLPLVIEAEVNFHPVRENAPLFGDLMNLLTKRNYILIDLRRIFWNSNDKSKLKNYSNKGFLILGDALFILDPFSSSNADYYSKNDSVYRVISLLCLYGYASEALSALNAFLKLEAIEINNLKKLEKIIIDEYRSPKKLPLVFGKILRRFNLGIENFVETPYSVKQGFGKNLNYQGDLMLGGDKFF